MNSPYIQTQFTFFPVGQHQRVAVDTAQALAAPAKASIVLIQAEGGTIRYRFDGGTATTTSGLRLAPTAGNVSTPSLTIDNTTGVKSLNLNVTGIAGQTVRHEYLVTVASASNPESYNPDVAVPIA
jgi:hypothetical protein